MVRVCVCSPSAWKRDASSGRWRRREPYLCRRRNWRCCLKALTGARPPTCGLKKALNRLVFLAFLAVYDTSFVCHNAASLPDDIESLRRLVAAQRSELDAERAARMAAEGALLSRDLLIEKLKVQIARLKRMHFGRSSEKLASASSNWRLRNWRRRKPNCPAPGIAHPPTQDAR